jgi:hypothetical protein
MEIASDIKKITLHMDTVGKQLNEQNDINNEKINMYKIMMESIIEEYFDICKKIY